MKTKIQDEAKEIYFAIKNIIENSTWGSDYCQSWWLNPQNTNLKSKLKTPQVVQRCKLLIKQGYLVKNQENTSTCKGTSYKLTDKEYLI